MEENICLYSSRCKFFSKGCTSEVANANNCGFIADIEKTKKLVKDSLLKVLRHSKGGGFYLVTDRWYEKLKEKALLLLTEGEFCAAEQFAIDTFFAEQKKKREEWEKSYRCDLERFLNGLKGGRRE